MHRRLFLDTCALIWLVQGSPKLSKSVRKSINEAELVFVSAISAWETSLKHERGQLILPKEPETWFEESMVAHNLTLYPLSVQVLTAANRLPFHHRDPADRFIIASALLEKCPVVTADEKFRAYEMDIVL